MFMRALHGQQSTQRFVFNASSPALAAARCSAPAYVAIALLHAHCMSTAQGTS